MDVAKRFPQGRRRAESGGRPGAAPRRRQMDRGADTHALRRRGPRSAPTRGPCSSQTWARRSGRRRERSGRHEEKDGPKKPKGWRERRDEVGKKREHGVRRARPRSQRRQDAGGRAVEGGRDDGGEAGTVGRRRGKRCKEAGAVGGIRGAKSTKRAQGGAAHREPPP